MAKQSTPTQLDATRQALQAFSKLGRKNCLAYEFVALKLSCSQEQAADLVSEVYRVDAEATKPKQPTSTQLAALVQFAAANGRRWKSELRHAWETGLYGDYYIAGIDTTALQQVRNSLGFSWLVNFRLPRIQPMPAAADCVECHQEIQEDVPAINVSLPGSINGEGWKHAECRKPDTTRDCNRCHEPYDVAIQTHERKDELCSDCADELAEMEADEPDEDGADDRG